MLAWPCREGEANKQTEKGRGAVGEAASLCYWARHYTQPPPAAFATRNPISYSPRLSHLLLLLPAPKAHAYS